MSPGIRVTDKASLTTVSELLGVRRSPTLEVGPISVAHLSAQLDAVQGPTYETRAQLFADLAWDAGAVGKVVGDANTAYRGIYKKAGASGAGSWTRIGPLPEADNEATAAEVAAARGGEVSLSAAMDKKAPIASPVFTGSPAAPTPTVGNNSTLLATTAFVKLAIDALIAAAPGALNTLNELAEALGNDPNFATTVTNALALKAPLISPAFSGTPTVPTAAPGTNTTQAASTAFVRAAIDALIAAAPGALDTLNELAAALGDDPNFATTVTNALATKVSTATLGLMASGGWITLTNQAGTSAITADVSAAVPAGWVLRTGQRVQLVAPATTEVRPLTLAINGGDPWPIYDNEGRDIPAGVWIQFRTYELRLAGSAGNYAWRLVSGADGPLIAALSQKARSLDLMGPLDDRDAVTPGYVATWRDKDGYMVAIDDHGVFHGAGFKVHQFPSDGDDRDYIGETLPLITLGGYVLVGRDPVTGEVLTPGLPTGTGYLPPASMRGDWGQFSVRSTTGLTYATVRDLAGDVYDIVQRQSAPTDTALISSLLPIEEVVGNGQSNAGGATAEAGAPIFDESNLPNRVLSLQVEGATGGSSQPATGYDEIYELEAKARGQSPVGCMMHVMAHLDTRANRRGHAYAVTNVWLGGRPIDDFFPGAGQFLYENLMSWTGALHEAAEKYRSAEVKAILWTQGENTQAGYEDLLGDYIDMIRPALRDEVGQADLPHFLFRMTNRPSNEVGPDANAVDLAQLAVARARLGAGVTMTGAMYHAPLWDTIHVTNLGRLLLAEQDGLAYEHVIRNGQVWHPLWPEEGGITRTGAVIRIPFELPPAAMGTLAWDEDWISPVSDKGFHYTDSGSGVTITSVEIDGLEVVVTLSADPGAATGKTISYARRGLTRLDGWAAARGQLYAPTRKRSVFAELGYAIPDYVRLPAIKFQEVIA